MTHTTHSDPADRTALRLLLLGLAPRLAVAAGIIAVLWLGFVWAVASPGGL